MNDQVILEPGKNQNKKSLQRRKLFLLIGFLLIFILVIHSLSAKSEVQKNVSESESEVMLVETPEDETVQEIQTATVTRVIDGDTIEIAGGKKVRYIGIDTPELKHPSKPVECFSAQATEKNKALVEGKEVRLESDVSETDRYGRLLRYVYVDDMFVNDVLVREGFAQASSYPPDVKHQDLFAESERYAVQNELGLWGDVCLIADTSPTPISPVPVATPFVSSKAQPQSTPAAVPKPTQKLMQQAPPATGYSCNCSKTCPNMSSCEEAYFQLNNCGCSARDGDGDGVPCESICPGG